MTADEMLTGPQVAAQLGIDKGTWRGYVARGQAPAPDDPDSDQTKERRTPRWRQSTVDAWRAARRTQAWARGMTKEERSG